MGGTKGNKFGSVSILGRKMYYDKCVTKGYNMKTCIVRANKLKVLLHDLYFNFLHFHI